MSTSFHKIYNLLKLQFSHPFTKENFYARENNRQKSFLEYKYKKSKEHWKHSKQKQQLYLMYLLYSTFCPLFRGGKKARIDRFSNSFEFCYCRQMLFERFCIPENFSCLSDSLLRHARQPTVPCFHIHLLFLLKKEDNRRTNGPGSTKSPHNF